VYSELLQTQRLFLCGVTPSRALAPLLLTALRVDCDAGATRRAARPGAPVLARWLLPPLPALPPLLPGSRGRSCAPHSVAASSR
jgi:hypothetical protein